MASYSAVIKPSVEKDLRGLSQPIVRRLWERIEAPSNEPIPRRSIKLAGAERLYRVRVGDYRIVYSVDHAAQVVTIQYVRHRSAAYK